MSAALVGYRLATAAGAPLIRLYMTRRQAAGKEDATRIAERFGVAARPRGLAPLVWFHAASVGEAVSVTALIERILARRPDVEVMMTTGTTTSARLMGERLPPRAFHQYAPVDRAAWVRRFLDHWRPDLALWVESELWPNMVLETHRRATPMALVNARMTARSARGWSRAPGLARRMLGCFCICLTQNDETTAALRRLGAANVDCVGNLKCAARPLPASAADLDRLGAVLGGRPAWLAASTHPGEEAHVGAAHRALKASRPDALTIIAPRHPRRGPEIKRELETAGLSVAMRSLGQAPGADADVYVADTMGELGLFYRLVDIAFIGGSLVPHGGQNPFEAAQLGCAALFGAGIANFRAMTDELLGAGAALKVADPGALAAAVAALFDDAPRRRAMIAAAAAVARRHDGVLDSVLDRLTPLIDRIGRARAAPAAPGDASAQA